MRVFLRSPFNYDRDVASVESGLVCEVETLAKQEFRDETDINTILRRFNVSGELPSGVRMPSFGDFTDVHDFQSAANAIAVAREAFDEMPADVRRRFNNDPQEFVAFCDDDANLAEARKLGLIPAEEVPAPVVQAAAAAPGAPAAPVVAPAAPGAPAASGAA